MSGVEDEGIGGHEFGRGSGKPSVVSMALDAGYPSLSGAGSRFGSCSIIDRVCYHFRRWPAEGGLAGLRWKAAD